MSPEDAARRHAVKRFNERVKLSATFLNNIGVASLVGAVVLPTAADPARALALHWGWYAAPIVLHLWGQVALSLFKSED